MLTFNTKIIKYLSLNTSCCVKSALEEPSLNNLNINGNLY